MTPQSNLMVLAPIAADRIDDLRQLLASMNRSPGVVDPQNTLVPFGQFDTLALRANSHSRRSDAR